LTFSALVKKKFAPPIGGVDEATTETGIGVNVDGIGVNVAATGVEVDAATSGFGMEVSVWATTVASTSGVGDAGAMTPHAVNTKMAARVNINLIESVNEFLIGSSFFAHCKRLAVENTHPVPTVL